MPNKCLILEFFLSSSLLESSVIWKLPNIRVCFSVFFIVWNISLCIENAKDMAITHEPDKYEGVLLVSGDGLVNQFVNGLMER